jgi:hypothetical protein
LASFYPKRVKKTKAKKRRRFIGERVRRRECEMMVGGNGDVWRCIYRERL